jgi:hypothetical protein
MKTNLSFAEVSLHEEGPIRSGKDRDCEGFREEKKSCNQCYCLSRFSKRDHSTQIQCYPLRYSTYAKELHFYIVIVKYFVYNICIEHS